MLNSDSDLSLSLARRQKRLLFWKKLFLSETENSKVVPAAQRTKLKEQLETYGLLLNKYPLIRESEELREAEERLSSMEREFNSFMETRRLLTSDVGIAAIVSEK